MEAQPQIFRFAANPVGRAGQGRQMRPIPPLNPLHVFEVAARAGSFTRAANELGVTQSAVSRQIASLEGYLGTKLFQRESKWITLTADGAEYYKEVGPALAQVSKATDVLLSRYKTNAVRVAGYPTFAVKWLIPRLSRFTAAHRNVQVKLKNSILPVNFDIDPFDLAIQLRRIEDMDPEWSEFLFPDVIQPHASPNFLDRHPVKTPQDLCKVPRLASHYRRSDWKDWMQLAGLGDIPDELDEFPSSLLTYQAASEGLGVAMGQTFLLREEVAAGTLVPLFTPIERDLAYFVIWNRNIGANARNFVRWLKAETGLLPTSGSREAPSGPPARQPPGPLPPPQGT